MRLLPATRSPSAYPARPPSTMRTTASGPSATAPRARVAGPPVRGGASSRRDAPEATPPPTGGRRTSEADAAVVHLADLQEDRSAARVVLHHREEQRAESVRSPRRACHSVVDAVVPVRQARAPRAAATRTVAAAALAGPRRTALASRRAVARRYFRRGDHAILSRSARSSNVVEETAKSPPPTPADESLYDQRCLLVASQEYDLWRVRRTRGHALSIAVSDRRRIAPRSSPTKITSADASSAGETRQRFSRETNIVAAPSRRNRHGVANGKFGGGLPRSYAAEPLEIFLFPRASRRENPLRRLRR